MPTFFVLLVAAAASSGCAANPRLRTVALQVREWVRPSAQPRCATRSVPMHWTDGTESLMQMTVCGYDWRAEKSSDSGR